MRIGQRIGLFSLIVISAIWAAVLVRLVCLGIVALAHIIK